MLCPSCVLTMFVFVLSLITSFLLFFFKQKTAYEMRISDWSSDVCSSDLARPAERHDDLEKGAERPGAVDRRRLLQRHRQPRQEAAQHPARKSVVSGKSVSVRVDLGGHRIIKKKKRKHTTERRRHNLNVRHTRS